MKIEKPAKEKKEKHQETFAMQKKDQLDNLENQSTNTNQSKIIKENECLPKQEKSKKPAKNPKKRAKKQPESEPVAEIKEEKPEKQRKTESPKDILDIDFEKANQNEQTDFEIPKFLDPAQLMDKNKNKVDSPYYDPTTIQLPADYYNSLQNIFKQYWDIKSQHFDKIVLYRVGFMYWEFQNDAFVMKKELNLNVKVFRKKPVSAFNAHLLCKQKTVLLNKGYKLIVVEQSKDMEENEESIKREIDQILTRGTSIDDTPESEQNSKYLISLQEKDSNWGFCLVDVTTNSFQLDQIQNNICDLAFLFEKMKPVEIVLMKNNVSSKTETILKNAGDATYSFLPNAYAEGVKEIFEKINQIFAEKKPDILKNWEAQFKNTMAMQLDIENLENEEENKANLIENSEFPQIFALQALNLLVHQLEQLKLIDSILLLGNFFYLDLQSLKETTMFLDPSIIQNLDIFPQENSNNFPQNNASMRADSSLFDQINQTKTAYGRKMLKDWLKNPIRNPALIQERLDSIDDLIINSAVFDIFRSKINKIPNIEKLLFKIQNDCSKKQLNQRKINENNEKLSNLKIKEFLDLIGHFKSIEAIILLFGEFVPKFKSKRLKQLLTFYTQKGEKEGLFPKISDFVKEIEEKISINENNEPVPAKGILPEQEQKKAEIEKIKDTLNEMLDEIRKKFKSNEINQQHKKYEYQIEIPEGLLDLIKRPNDFILTSKVKGFSRFHTDEIAKKVEEIHSLENEIEATMLPVINALFQKLWSHNKIWMQAISCIAEFDCLCSLAKAAMEMKEEKCRPEFIFDGKQLEIRQNQHPILKKMNTNFVSNDILMDQQTNAIIVTGPNMGGKSTIMRQIGISIILAQMGAQVPAKSAKLSIFDKMFCRIGSFDRIFEKKSSFFMEMENALNFIENATQSSFVIIDEIGRGTSTFDGVGIAQGILRFCVEKIKCKTLFSTHFHILVDEFKLQKNVKNYYMKQNFDEGKKAMLFQQNFVEGVAEKSFGINIGKIVGLPNEIIEIAKIKSEEMTNNLETLKNMQEIDALFAKAFDSLLNLCSYN